MRNLIVLLIFIFSYLSIASANNSIQALVERADKLMGCVFTKDSSCIDKFTRKELAERLKSVDVSKFGRRLSSPVMSDEDVSVNIFGHMDFSDELRDQSFVQIESTRPYSSSLFIHETLMFLLEEKPTKEEVSKDFKEYLQKYLESHDLPLLIGIDLKAIGKLNSSEPMNAFLFDIESGKCDEHYPAIFTKAFTKRVTRSEWQEKCTNLKGNDFKFETFSSDGPNERISWKSGDLGLTMFVTNANQVPKVNGLVTHQAGFSNVVNDYIGLLEMSFSVIERSPSK